MGWLHVFAIVFLASACAARVVGIGPIGMQYAELYRHRAFHLDGDSEYDEKPDKLEILATLFNTCADRSVPRLEELKNKMLRQLKSEMFRKTTTPAPIQAPDSSPSSSSSKSSRRSKTNEIV